MDIKKFFSNKYILEIILVIPISAIVFYSCLVLKIPVFKIKLAVILLLILVMIGTFWVQYFKMLKDKRSFWAVFNSLLGEEDINEEDKNLNLQPDNFCNFGSKVSTEHKKQSKK